MYNAEHLRPAHADQNVILLVDDEPLIRNIARIALEAEGYFMLVATDGEEGLLLSRTFSGIIHLLLSDVKMPKIDGLQLAQKLSEERPHENACQAVSAESGSAAASAWGMLRGFKARLIARTAANSA